MKYLYIYLLSIIVPSNKTDTQIYPQYSEVAVGSNVEFTCVKSSSKIFTTWFFNKQYYISNDIRIEKHSIVIDNVQLNHYGSYQCVKAYYPTQTKFAIYMASAELKVLGK